MSKYNAILIPGGGVREGGDLPYWVKKRLDRVLEIHKQETIITLSGGTVHRPPPVDENGFPIFESVAGAKYLIKMGIEPDRIFTEINSYDTIGNAYFSRVIHVDPGNFRSLLIITSEFHMPRTESIFRWVFGLDISPGKIELDFESVPDDGIPRDILLARKRREKKSLAQFRKTKKKIRSLKQLHQWLYTDHAAYALSLDPQKESGKTVNSY